MSENASNSVALEMTNSSSPSNGGGAVYRDDNVGAREVVDTDELAAILQRNDPSSGGEHQDDCCQIVDADGNLITITSDQLAQAGIDISNISENDVQTLLQLAQAGSSRQHHSSSITVGNGGASPDNIRSGKRRVGANNALSRDVAMAANEKQRSPKKAKLMNDLVAAADYDDVDDGDGYSSNTSPALNRNTSDDVTELDEATLASLVESGTVKFVDEAGNEIPAASVMAAAQGGSILGNTSESSSNQRKCLSGSSMPRITRSTIKGSAPLKASPGDSNSALLGQEVKVKRGHRRVPATIRYVRPGIGYKVQFEDGRFEWVGENDVVMVTTSSSSATAANSSSGETPGYGQTAGIPSSGDHVYLIDDDDEEEEEENSLLNNGVAMETATTSSIGGAAVGSHHSSTPMTSSSVAPKKQTINGSSILSRYRSINNAAKMTPPGGASGFATCASSAGNSNFVCPICETKVCNKEPSYIVIRLPACELCAESKILVLDENEKNK